MSYEHFARQEEEISNTYMSANGEGTIDIPKLLRVKSPSALKIYGGVAILFGLGLLVYLYNKNKK